MPDNNEQTTQQIGYYDGILDIYYALMQGTDSAAARPTYGTPQVLAMTVEATITPRYREGNLHASNKRVRNERRISGYEVSLNLDQVPAAQRRAVTGRQADNNGVEAITDTQAAPYVAILFAITKDNGEKELWVIYKGKFQEFEKDHKTQDDSIEYQTPTLTGNFDARIYDGKIASVLDTDAADADATTVAGWFTSVYEVAT